MTDRIVIFNKQAFVKKLSAALLAVRRALPYIFVGAGVLASYHFRLMLSRIDVNSPLLLDYIEALRWPVMILLLAFLLRQHIPAILARITKINVGNTAIELSAQQSSDQPESKILEEITEPAGTQVDPEDLYQSPAVRLEFEKIYRTIFGTQLEALLRLNVFSDGLSSKDLESLLTKHMSATDNKVFTNIIDFMQYLVNVSLVTYDAPTGIFKALPATQYFLRYVNEEELLKTNPLSY